MIHPIPETMKSPRDKRPFYSNEERKRRSERATRRNFKHGYATRGIKRPPEYYVWTGMKNRCFNWDSKDFPRYGGRGITICEKWNVSFAAFLADMGKRPSPSHQIERINNDGDYEPGNCMWATPKQQAENRRSTVLIEYDNKILSVTEWSRLNGIGITTIFYRLNAGWDIGEALTVKPRYKCTKFHQR